jgi:hypothetical protein
VIDIDGGRETSDRCMSEYRDLAASSVISVMASDKRVEEEEVDAAEGEGAEEEAEAAEAADASEIVENR